ncbi:eukaryotic type KH-domain (KH-domain type I) [Hypoxylon sp. FL1150]|nr:eukaryotic type KH-domain (KH-domain type I) [Hypoxylon sp. FL1150]
MAPTNYQRRSRWGPEASVMEMTTSVTAAMTSEQIDAYVLHLRIEEITHKLSMNDIVPANRHRRCPSPEPQYDSSSRRTNTSYHRQKESLEKERHSLIQTALHKFPNYNPPQDYVQNSIRWRKIKEKVYIPVKEFPEVNFIGQILGPRGRSLTKMNDQSHATIQFRGRGSVKEGKGRRHRRNSEWVATDDHQEPLHCLITADTQQSVDRAKELIQEVVETAITIPELENDRKREQLRDLAKVNGTFRDYEGTEHGANMIRTLPATTGIVCYHCDGVGHLSRDCRTRKMERSQKIPPWRRTNTKDARLETEDALDLAYSQFLAEIGSD